MTEITLIFPDQLFQNHPCLNSSRLICLAEEFLFFKVQPFHKQRLVLLKAAMRRFSQTLLNMKKDIIYISSKDLNKRGDLFKLLADKGATQIHVAEFADNWLSEDLKKAEIKYKWKIHFYPSPGFLCSNEEIHAFFADKKHYSMAQFYIYQRKKLNILMDGQSPLGGKYSFDSENRKKLPKKIFIPPPLVPPQIDLIKQVIDEVETDFFDAIGKAKPFLYPTTHDEAQATLSYFLKYKLANFGDYQDAIEKDNSFLFHSILSPIMNIGLITPEQVIESTLTFADENDIPFNSLEGFIRQVIGWREFVKASYLFKGKEQRTYNFFNHHKKIPSCFWIGETGIPPIDNTIKSILQTGYAHHIERLMVLGNFLLLTETSPSEVYKWFMGYFVDAYDWVMVSNVYGMSQYADGGSIVTKPYISSSNYILKMSNYPKGDWTEIWDGLFWRFFQKHLKLFKENHRTQALVQLLVKNQNSITPKIQKANFWLDEYYKK